MEDCIIVIDENMLSFTDLLNLHHKCKFHKDGRCSGKGICFSTLALGSWLFFPISCDLHISPLWWEDMPIGGQRWATHPSLWHAISHLLSLNSIWWVLTSSIFPLKTLCLKEVELVLLSCYVLCLGRFRMVS